MRRYAQWAESRFCERKGGRKGDKEGTGKEISEELKKAEGG